MDERRYKPCGTQGCCYETDKGELVALQALLAEHGMVAVPVEPTEAMIEAVKAEWEGSRHIGHRLRQIYKAMVKAAEAEAALNRQPAQSLAAIRAQTLREFANSGEVDGVVVSRLYTAANRIEQEGEA